MPCSAACTTKLITMKKEKSNIDHLRDLLKDVVHANKEEVFEFLEAAEYEIDELKNEKTKLQEELDDLESLGSSDDDEDEEDDFNSENLGLDTFNWKLDHGNIVIEEHIQAFVTQMKRKYAMLPA